MQKPSRFPTLPVGEVVASYSSYERAQEGVDRLARNEGFSVQSISIVGSDLKSVERVTGRMNTGKAALNGALSGLFLGMFFGATMMLFMPEVYLATLVGVLLLATVFGAVWGMIVYAISPNKREFASMMQLTASHYDVIVPHGLAAEARQILGAAAVTTQAQVPAAYGQQPGGYGVPPAGFSAPQAQPQHGNPATVQPGVGTDGASVEPVATPLRTYGEMLDERRRQQREASVSSGEGEAAESDSHNGATAGNTAGDAERNE